LFISHGLKDDMISWAVAKRTYQPLRKSVKNKDIKLTLDLQKRNMH